MENMIEKIKKNVSEWNTEVEKNQVLWLSKEEEKALLFNYEDFFWVSNTLPESIKYYNQEVEYNQWTTSRCTAYSWTAVSNHTQYKDIKQYPLFNPDYVWKLQTEVYPKTGSEAIGDYLVAPFQLFQKIGVEWKSPTSDKYLYKIQYYYLINNDKIDTIKDALVKFWPLWMWWKFNRAIFDNVKKYWYMDLLLSDTWASTFWHAMAMIWYDSEWFIIQDSYKWRSNNIFKVKYDKWLKGYTDWTFFKGVIVPVDTIDNWKFNEEIEAKLFDDVWLGMKQNEPEIYEAIKWTKNNGIFQWSNGKFLPNEPITRKHIAVVLKRFYDMLNK